MVSRKRSAQQKRVAEFKAGLGGMDDAFELEGRRRARANAERELVLRAKSCESKQRYASRQEALAAIASCAEHGTKGLRCYRCEYCRGWHLTSRPQGGSQ